eukprot:3012322-Lingulodinium_polyedra.AAC.1
MTAVKALRRRTVGREWWRAAWDAAAAHPGARRVGGPVAALQQSVLRMGLGAEFWQRGPVPGAPDGSQPMAHLAKDTLR